MFNSWTIANVEVIRVQSKPPFGQTTLCACIVQQLLQSIMVRADSALIPFKVMAQMEITLDNSKTFTFGCRVILLCWLQSSTPVPHRAQLVIFLFL